MRPLVTLCFVLSIAILQSAEEPYIGLGFGSSFDRSVCAGPVEQYLRIIGRSIAIDVLLLVDYWSIVFLLF